MMLDHIRAVVAQYAMFSPGQTVVVGISGGPDSTALLYALCSLRDEWGIQLVAAHLNHNFRGEEAAQDAEYVREFAAELGIPVRIALRDVPSIKKRTHLSSQQAAREVRHAFLREVAEEFGAERIALAHTQDDRVETVLLNLFRGTGMEGLQGFPAVSLPIVRPLYDVRRNDIQSYCTTHDLHPRTDSSNASLDYRRNRIRAELLPYVRTYFNQGVDDAITRMADLVSADNAYMEVAGTDALKRATVHCDASRITLSATRLQTEAKPLQRRALRQAIGAIRGHLQEITFETIERILTALELEKSISFFLPAANGVSLQVVCNRELVDIDVSPPAEEKVPFAIALPIGGQVSPPGALAILECREYRRGAEAVKAVEALPGGAWSALFQKESVRLPLLVRSVRPGDRMRWRGLAGSKKLQDLFTDEKVPVSERKSIPLIVEDGGNGRILTAGTLRRQETALSVQECSLRNENILMLIVYREEGQT